MSRGYASEGKSVARVTFDVVLILLASVAIHETMHVLQFWSLGIPINEVSFFGYQNLGERGTAVGWVIPICKSDVRKKCEIFYFLRDDAEIQAFFVQGVFIATAFVVYWSKLDRPVPRKSEFERFCERHLN